MLRIYIGFIKHTLEKEFSVESAKMLYCALFRSKLELASVVWLPFQDLYIEKIESVQKDFVIWSLRALFQRDENNRLPPYELRCIFLKIHTLLGRRISDSIFLIHDLLLGILISKRTNCLHCWSPVIRNNREKRGCIQTFEV